MSGYRNSYLIKLIVGFTIYSVLLISLLGGILFNQADQTMINEISKENEYRLKSVVQYVENTMLKKYEDFFGNKVSSTVNPNSTDEVAFFLNQAKKNNYYAIVTLHQDLQASKLVNEGVHNITLMYTHSGLLVDTNRFYEQMTNSEDAAFVKEMPQADHHRWFVRTSGGGEKVLTYIYTLPLKATGDSVKGYMYIDVDIDYLTQELQGMLVSPSETMYVVDQQYRLIASTDPELSVVPTRFDQRSNDTVDIHMDLDREEENVIASTKKALSSKGWTYATVRPIASYFLVSKDMKNYIIIACLIVFVAGFMISILLSRKFYDPLKRIISSLRSKSEFSKFPQKEGEHGFIHHILNDMDKQIVSLNEQLEERNIHRLLEGDFVETAGFGLAADSRFIVAKFKVRSRSPDSFLKQYDIGYLETYGRVVAKVIYEGSAVVIVELLQAGSEDLLIRELEHLQHPESDEWSFAIGVGNPVHEPEEISKSYNEASQALKYTFLFGEHSIISYDQVKYRKAGAEIFDFSIFTNTLQAGDFNGVEKFLKTFEERLRSSDYRIEAVELAIMQISTVLAEVLIPYHLDDIHVKNIDGSLSFQRDTLKESMDQLREVCMKMTEEIKNSKEHSHSETMLKLKEYVAEHLHEDISLDMLADMSSISPSYISKLFNELLHVSFSEYLTQLRMNKAADLLKNSTDSVTEIAQKTGYRNVQYFSTKFKSRFGVTPSNYRNQMD